MWHRLPPVQPNDRERPHVTVKAIEIGAVTITNYGGCRFRSRLEARYAVFFDWLGIKWDYEPGGLSTSDGGYLPDFLLHLPDHDVWFEVQEGDDQDDDPRWRHLVAGTQTEHIVARGMPRPDGNGRLKVKEGDGWMQSLTYWPDGIDEQENVGWDNCRAFCVCLTCDNVGITFEGESERLSCCGGDVPGREATPNHPRILAALRAARSARFEYYERG